MSMTMLLLFIARNSHGQQKNSNPASQYVISRLSTVKWGKNTGLPYKQVPGANLGVTSFEILSHDKIAYLCNSTSEIFITNKISGKVIRKFSVEFAPRDFVYDNGFFYVLNETQVTTYTETGKLIKKTSFPETHRGVERLTRYNNVIFLQLPSGNSLMLDKSGISEKSKEFEGIITGDGNFVSTEIDGNNSYLVRLIKEDGRIYVNTFLTDKKVAGVYVVGSTKNRIVLDVQTFISENPIVVERKIVSVDLNETGIGTIVSMIKVPDSYYVLSNKDIYLTKAGDIINMITSPSGVFIYSLAEKKTGIVINNYPASLLAIKYHFNNHLLNLDK